jgi:hypothetical protein
VQSVVGGTALRHVPIPSQVRVLFTVAPVQVASTHEVPAVHFRQPPAPSHVPSRPHVEVDSAVHNMRGSGAAIDWNVQNPREPVMLHARHAPSHALSQQTPSTQNPDWHSRPGSSGAVPNTQAVPSGFFLVQSRVVPWQ